MPQLSITPAVSPQPSAGISQTSASVAEGGDGLESAPGLNFGSVLAKQLKGIASLSERKEDVALSLVAVKESAELAANAGVKGIATRLEQKEDAGLSLDAVKESTAPVANIGFAVLPVDLSALAASMLAPVLPFQTGARAVIPAEVVAGVPLMRRDSSEVRLDSLRILGEDGVENPLMRLSKGGEIRLAAEIAASGKNLPQEVSPEQMFAGKLAALVEAPAGNAGGTLHSTDLSTVQSPSATAVVFRNPEPLPALPVASRVGSAEWGGAVGEKIVWMANQSHQVAELHLNPPNLGPLEVRLTISNDQASALFVSPHFAVREAIETALPRLREMLADNGIMLGNVTVGSESFSQQQASDQGNGKEGSRKGLAAESVMARMAVPGMPAGRATEGMVDIFA